MSLTISLMWRACERRQVELKRSSYWRVRVSQVEPNHSKNPHEVLGFDCDSDVYINKIGNRDGLLVEMRRPMNSIMYIHVNKSISIVA